MANVRVVKLVSGEDVVCDLVEGDGSYALKNPARFVVTPQGVGMMPFSPFSKSTEFVVKEAHVICVGEVEEEIYNAWSSQFGSGIVLAGSDVRAAAKSLKISPNT